jgi:hypothetical protein
MRNASMQDRPGSAPVPRCPVPRCQVQKAFALVRFEGDMYRWPVPRSGSDTECKYAGPSRFCGQGARRASVRIGTMSLAPSRERWSSSA